ncbi:MAG TPA: thioredoxin family protein [Candidatus Sulfotelmatobacter sp.]|nr:thioredoxin family protein [Candidatus Sulfotelmatobacter sp.]
MLKVILLAWILPVASLAAGPLEIDWWQKDSPELILSNAEATTRGLGFLHAQKSGTASIQITNPFQKPNSHIHLELFQRKNPDGTLEIKRYIQNGTFQWTYYALKSGNYVFINGRIIKREYKTESDDDDEYITGDDYTINNSVARQFEHPYEYRLVKFETVGTNDCIVIARCMTMPFLNQVKAVVYKGVTKAQEAAFGGDLRRFIRSETDYYIRKNDTVIIGEIKRNYHGEELEDWLFDQVEINKPLSDKEFSLPEGKILIAKSQKEEEQEATVPNDRVKAEISAVEKKMSRLPWVAGLPEALEKAKSENKIILLDFTGSDWCVWCRKFDEDVLSQPEFVAYAKTNLVMVLLDFPHFTTQTDALKTNNAALQAEFKVIGFPTYVALNPAGQEIGRKEGYLEGGPKAFISKLEQIRRSQPVSPGAGKVLRN